MQLITLYLLIGLIIEFLGEFASRWSSPEYKSPKIFEKVIVVVIWPFVVILFVIFLVIELLKLRK